MAVGTTLWCHAVDQGATVGAVGGGRVERRRRGLAGLGHLAARRLVARRRRAALGLLVVGGARRALGHDGRDLGDGVVLGLLGLGVDGRAGWRVGHLALDRAHGLRAQGRASKSEWKRRSRSGLGAAARSQKRLASGGRAQGGLPDGNTGAAGGGASHGHARAGSGSAPRRTVRSGWRQPPTSRRGRPCRWTRRSAADRCAKSRSGRSGAGAAAATSSCWRGFVGLTGRHLPARSGVEAARKCAKSARTKRRTLSPASRSCRPTHYRNPHRKPMVRETFPQHDLPCERPGPGRGAPAPSVARG